MVGDTTDGWGIGAGRAGYVHDYVDPLRTCVLWYYYKRFVKKHKREEGTRNQLASWFLVAPHAK